MKIKLLIVLLVGLFSVFGVHAGGVGADCGGCSAQTNNDNLAIAMNKTKEALELTNQGNQEKALAAITEAKIGIKAIVTGNIPKNVKKSKASYEIADAKSRIQKGKLDEAIAFMEKAIRIMDKIGTFE